jgi:hypothetical protein
VLALFAAATAWMTRPLLWHAAGHLVETCDNYLTIWMLAWDLHALATHPLNLFDANIFFPLKGTLALSEHMLGNAPIFALAMALSGNAVLALNAVILASFLLSGLTMTWLVYHWTGRPGPSVAAGFVWAFVPYRIQQLSHMQLLSLQWLPLAVYFEDRLLREGRRGAWIGFTVFTLWQCLVSYYLAYLTAAVVAAYGAGLAWRCHATIGGRRPAAAVAALGVVALAMVPLTLPYKRMQDRGVIPRFSSPRILRQDPNALALAEPLRTYVSVPRTVNHPLHRLLTAESRHLPWEKGLFPGIVPLAVIGAAVALRRRTPPAAVGRGTVAGLVAVLVVGWVLSLGPWLTWNDELTMIELPAYWIARVVPGFSGIRAWVRFGFAVFFALAGLFGIALARLIGASGGLTRAVVLAGVLAAMTFEYNMAPLDLTPAPPRATPAHAWLAEHGDRGALLILPTGAVPPCVHARYMYHSTVHWLPLLSGYSGYIPIELAHTNEMALALPSPAALRDARGAGVRWLLVEWSGLPPGQEAALHEAEADGRLVPAARFETETIYDLGRAQPAQPASAAGRR